MQTQDANLSLPGTKDKANGRKSQDGAAEILKGKPIKDACAEMMKAYKKVESAKSAYNEMVAAVVKRSNANVTTLKKLVRSSAVGNFTDVQHKIEQEQEIFETVGEIAGGKSNGDA